MSEEMTLKEEKIVELGENLVDSATGEIVGLAKKKTTPRRGRARLPGDTILQAQIALLENEVISRLKNPDLFRLVNNQFGPLQEWHDQHTGWRIRRSPAVIRLVRTPAVLTPGYSFRTLSKPRDFACFSWTLWYAETLSMSGRGSDQQFLMSQLAERLEEQSSIVTLAPHVAPLDFRKHDDRYSLARALRTLQDLDGLHLVDGGTEAWVTQTGDADALWEFTEVTRSLMLALDPARIVSAGQMLDGNPHTLEPVLLPDFNLLKPIERAWRTLLLGPVLFHYDDPEAFKAVKENAEEFRRTLGDTFGWALDLRYEYAQIVRVSGTMLGPIMALNLQGATDQAALLCCDVLRRNMRQESWQRRAVGSKEDGCFLVSSGDIADIFRLVREQYGDRWGNTAKKMFFPLFLGAVYDKMRLAGLLRGPDRHGNVLLLPTIARYDVGYPLPPPPPEEMLKETPPGDQPELFGQDAVPTRSVATRKQKYYTTAETAIMLFVSKSTVLNWILKGKINGVKENDMWMIPHSEIKRIQRGN